MRRLGVTTIVAIAMLAVGVVELVDGALSAGVTIDEPTQLERTWGWISHGWYVPEPFMINGVPDPHNELASPFVYGPAYSALAHLANVELGKEPIGGVSGSADAYAVRHLVVAALALLAIAAAGLAVWFLSRSWRAGLWSASALSAIPVWLGQGFFNVKDVPAATGYTLATVALVLAIGGAPPRRRRQAAIVVLLAIGIFIGAGTRLALWAPIAASLLLYALLRLGQARRGGMPSGRGRDGAVLAGAVLGFAAIAAIYPRAAETPRTLLTHSISDSAGYPNESLTLTAGQLLPEHPPWWYLPTWIGADMPVLIGALAILGGGAALVGLWRSRRAGGAGALWRRKDLGVSLVLLQLLLLPALSVAGDATMYDALRQHLYVIPALAILAGLGAARFASWAARDAVAPAWRAIAPVTLSLALIVPMAEQTLLFPYNYTYVNPIAGLRGVNGEWETDYWFSSAREALTRIPPGARLLCSTSLIRLSDPAAKPTYGECSQAFFEPFEDERGSAIKAPTPVGGTWVISWPRGQNHPPPYCEDADDVTRWLRGERVIMAYVLRCDPGRVNRALREERESPPAGQGAVSTSAPHTSAAARARRRSRVIKGASNASASATYRAS